MDVRSRYLRGTLGLSASEDPLFEFMILPDKVKGRILEQIIGLDRCPLLVATHYNLPLETINLILNEYEGLR